MYWTLWKIAQLHVRYRMRQVIGNKLWYKEKQIELYILKNVHMLNLEDQKQFILLNLARPRGWFWWRNWRLVWGDILSSSLTLRNSNSPRGCRISGHPLFWGRRREDSNKIRRGMHYGKSHQHIMAPSQTTWTCTTLNVSEPCIFCDFFTLWPRAKLLSLKST